MLTPDNVTALLTFIVALSVAAAAYKAVSEDVSEKVIEDVSEDVIEKVIDDKLVPDVTEELSLGNDSEKTVTTDSIDSIDSTESGLGEGGAGPDLDPDDLEIPTAVKSSETGFSDPKAAMDGILNQNALGEFEKLVEGRLEGNKFDDFLRKRNIMKSSIEISEGEKIKDKIDSKIKEIQTNIPNMNSAYATDFAERCKMYASQWPGSRTPRGVIFDDLKLFVAHGPYSKDYILGKIDLLAESFEKRGGGVVKLDEVKEKISDLKDKVESFLDGELTEDKMNSMVKMNTEIDKYLNEKIGRTPRIQAIDSLVMSLVPAVIGEIKREGPGKN